MRVMHYIHFTQRDQSIAVATGDWVQQDLVGDAEHGRRPADAQSEDQDGHQRGARILAQYPQAVAKIPNEVLNPIHSPLFAARFLDRLHPAELSQRRITRLLGCHATCDVLRSLQLQMRAYLLVHLGIELFPTEERPDF